MGKAIVLYGEGCRIYRVTYAATPLGFTIDRVVDCETEKEIEGALRDAVVLKARTQIEFQEGHTAATISEEGS